MSTDVFGYLTRKSQAFSSSDIDFSINTELQDGSDVSVIGQSPTRWATLERDRLKLDVGKWEKFYFAEKHDNLGVVTKIQSDSSGNFATPIKITAKIINRENGQNTYITQSGITFLGANFIKSASIVAYRDNTVVLRKSFTDADTLNTDLGYEKKQVFLAGLDTINKVEFIVNSIDKPYNFFYCFDFRFEAEEEFRDNSLLSVESNNKFSVLGDVLEYSTLDFELKKDEYERIFQKNEKISVVKDTESFQFFSQQYSDVGNVYSVNCADLTSLLEGEFLGGMYTNYSAMILIEDCVGSDLSEFFAVSSSLADIKLSGHIPITTKREALQQILLAANARKFKTGDVEFFSAFKQDLNPFVYDETNIIGEPTIVRNEPLKKIIVREHNFSKNSEEVEVYSHTIPWRGSKIQFDEPLWNVRIYNRDPAFGVFEEVITPLPVNEFLDVYDNYCVVNSMSNYNVVIKANKYTDSVVEYIKENPYVVENQDYLTKTVDLYVHYDSQAVCDLLYELYSRPYSITFRTLNCPILGEKYNILGYELHVRSIKDDLSGVYEVEAC